MKSILLFNELAIDQNRLFHVPVWLATLEDWLCFQYE